MFASLRGNDREGEAIPSSKPFFFFSYQSFLKGFVTDRHVAPIAVGASREYNWAHPRRFF
jgi:hypothetical protein